LQPYTIKMRDTLFKLEMGEQEVATYLAVFLLGGKKAMLAG